MRTRLFLILTLICSARLVTPAQDVQLPRDPDKLIDRVQKFWKAMTSSQRYSALELVLPEERDLFLSGTPAPIVKAKVVGLDLSDKRDEAAVRVALDVFSAESASGFFSWTVTDQWVWKNGEWYLHVTRPPDLFSRTSAAPAINSEEIRKKIETTFQILRNPIDLGTLIQGEYPPPLEVPITYTGDLSLSLELGLPNPLVDLAVMNEPITSRTKNFVLILGTEKWEGPFTLPLPLKIKYENVVVERTLTVKGNVFVPVAFRQSPEDGPVLDKQFSIFIRNNTDDRAPIHAVLVDGKMDLIKRPEALLPHEEVEVIFKTHPNESPDRLFLTLDAPIQGRSAYTYPIKHSRR
jgi:hypothetical protein